ISRVEDEIYGDFCRRLGYSDIREYEAQQGSLQQEAAQKKLEFTKQKSKIENQLGFEKQRLQATDDRINGLKTQDQRDRDLISELQTERENIQGQLDSLNAELEFLGER